MIIRRRRQRLPLLLLLLLLPPLPSSPLLPPLPLPPRHLGGDYVVGGYDNEVMRGRTGQGGGCTGRDGSRLGGTGTVRDRAGTGRDGPRLGKARQ